MDTGIIVLVVIGSAVVLAVVGSCIYCCVRSNNSANKTESFARPMTTEEPSGPPTTSGHVSIPITSQTGHSLSAEKVDGGAPPSSGGSSHSGPLLPPPPTLLTPVPVSDHRPYSKTTTQTKTTMSTGSFPEQPGIEKNRLKLKQFKFIQHHKKFTRLPVGHLTHSFSNISRKQGPIQKLQAKEMRGDIVMYSADFDLPIHAIIASRRKNEIQETLYHLNSPVMDTDEYRRKRIESVNIPELFPVEGNHDKNKNCVEGTPYLELKPHLAKMPAKRDDTIRHFLLNTQYASRLAFRFVCESGRYISIPSHDIIEPTTRCRVVLIANCDADGQTEMETVYFEYVQIPERAVDALREFSLRPVIGRVKLRLFPCFINLSPNTFYPSTRRRTTVYTSTLTNGGKMACKFEWPDNRDVMVTPQSGYIKPQSSVQFSFTLKRKLAHTAIVAEMKYNLTDKPAHGTLTVRFETDEMKRMIQLSTKALSACDTAEDPGFLPMSNS